MTEITAQSIDAVLRKQLDALNTSVESRETGSVIQVGDGIARVDGLKNAMAGELLEFTSSTGRVVYGMAQNLEEDEVGAVLLGDVAAIKLNDAVKTTGRLVEVPSGKALLGRVVNPLGMPLDGKGEIKAEGTRPVEFKAPGVIHRKPVQVSVSHLEILEGGRLHGTCSNRSPQNIPLSEACYNSCLPS